MNEPTPAAGESAPTDRWALIRDIAMLQVKLVVDGLRDFLLVPVSLATGIYSLLAGGDKPGTEFYDLLRYGRRTERMINLFGAAERVHGPAEDEAPLPDLDDVVARVETFVVDEYRKGGITAQAKRRIDQALDAARKTRLRRGSASE